MNISFKFGKIILPFIGVTLLLSSLNFLGCGKISTGEIEIVTTTTLIGTVVKEIGKDKVDVVTIVPGGMCPGHFDVRPGDISKLSRAKLLLSHGWEVWISDLLSSIDNGKLLTKTIEINGNWMVPDVQITAAEEITEVLCEVDPRNSPFYKENLNHYKEKINSFAAGIEKISFHGKKVVCSEYQAGLLKWLGFDVVATYGRLEDLSVKGLMEIISRAKEENVKLVVDNLQSGSNVGEQIAGEIGSKHIVLTNFPLGNSYIESLKENINKITRAVK